MRWSSSSVSYHAACHDGHPPPVNKYGRPRTTSPATMTTIMDQTPAHGIHAGRDVKIMHANQRSSYINTVVTAWTCAERQSPPRPYSPTKVHSLQIAAVDTAIYLCQRYIGHVRCPVTIATKDFSALITLTYFYIYICIHNVPLRDVCDVKSRGWRKLKRDTKVTKQY